MYKGNSFATNLVDKYIKIFLNKQFALKIVEQTVPKKELFIVLPYLGTFSLCFTTSLRKRIITTFDFVKLKLFLNDQDD